MPKKAAFSKDDEQAALEYLLSLGFELKKSRAKTPEGRAAYLIRQANAARKAEQAGEVPNQQAGRGKHEGKAKEQHALPIYKIEQKGWTRAQYLMYNFPSKVTGREITAKDIGALYKAAGRPSHVTIIISGTVRWDSPTEGMAQDPEEELPCVPATLVAHTRTSTMEAIVKRKLSLFEVANDLLRYGPDAQKKKWCTIDYIGMYATPHGEGKKQ